MKAEQPPEARDLWVVIAIVLIGWAVLALTGVLP